MNNSINANGISFRLQDDGSLLITTPTGQYQIQAQWVADLFDLLSASQGGFLDASSDLPTWARERAPDHVVIGQIQVNEETPPRSLERIVSIEKNARLFIPLGCFYLAIGKYIQHLGLHFPVRSCFRLRW